MTESAMSELAAYIDGTAVIGPGFADWPAAEAVLAGRVAYATSPTVLPVPLALPAAERRRAGRVVKLAIAVGLEATGRAGVDPAGLLMVFSSSGGDGDNCNEICEALATTERQLSPTRFHNSVHNAPAGYWSIATGSMAASTALCAHDASFGAGLLEALVLVASENRPVLLIACDTRYPPPLDEQRPIKDAFGIGLLLAPGRGERSVARLSAALGDGTPDGFDEPGLEALRLGVPAGRALPLLALLARRQARSVAIEYQGATLIRAGIEPC